MKPIDPRLLRHAKHSRAGIALLTAIGVGQALATVTVAVALTVFLTGTRSTAVVLIAAAFGVRALLTWAEQVVAHRTAASVSDELRRTLVRAVARRGPAWVAGFGSGRLTALLTGGLDALRPWFAGYLPAVILGVALPPLVLLAILYVDPASALIALATLPLIPLLGALIGWATEARARQRWQADARLAGHFLDAVRGLATLRTFGRAARQTAVIEDLTDRHRAATLRVLRVAFLSSTALDLVGTLSVGLIAVSTGLRVAAGHLPLAPALLIILLAPEVYRPLREMAARYHAATDATAVIADVDEVLTDLPGALPAGNHPGLSAAALRVRYASGTRDALDLPELVVGTGEIVALTGPSGAGKTTALRALAGLQPLDAGTIAVDCVPLYVPQRPSLPHARTVADLFPEGTATADIEAALCGVGLAVPHGSAAAARPASPAPSSPVSARSAPSSSASASLAPSSPVSTTPALSSPALASPTLRRVGATQPPGYDNFPPRSTTITATTPLGEHGSGVSAGQRHRLALAAALFRGPGTLLLDEPTAHLDPETEQLVIARLREAAAAGSAILVAAHRPALIAAADRRIEIKPPDPEHAPDTPPAATAPAAQRIDDTTGTAPQASETTSSIADVVGTNRSGWARWQRPSTAVALGSASSLSGLVLTGAAAWLLIRAASLPPVLTLSAAVVLVRGSAVARPLLRYLERLVSHDVAFARLGKRRARVYEALIPRVPGAKLRRRGDLLTKVADDVDAEVDGLLRGRLPARAAWITLAVGAAAAALVAPATALPVAAGLLLAGVVAPIIAARHATRQDRATAEARARLNDAMVETVDGIEELRGPGLLGVPERRSRKLAAREARAARSAGVAGALAHLGWGVAVAGAALALGHAGLSHEWTGVVLLGLVVLGESALGLPETAVARMRATGAEHRLAELITEPISTREPIHAAEPTNAAEPINAAEATSTAETEASAGAILGAPRTAPAPDREGPSLPPPTDNSARQSTDGIRIHNLEAGWNDDRKPIHGLDLTLEPGRKLAITGRSGEGKTTLGLALAGLIAPRNGTITINGRDIRAIPERAVVLVSDDTSHIFATTVRENLKLAKPTAGDEEIREALERVRLGDWLAQTPDGLDTWLGTGGSTISGGQARRLATARALLADPELLILDEPTEGLDEPTARALMTDLLDAADGRTVIVLTHRREGLERTATLTLSGGVLR